MATSKKTARPAKKAMRKIAGTPAKKNTLKKINKQRKKKEVADHVADLLEAANKGRVAGAATKILLKKANTLDPHIKKFNTAIQLFPQLKGFEFHSFVNPDAAVALEEDDPIFEICCKPRPCRPVLKGTCPQ